MIGTILNIITAVSGPWGIAVVALATFLAFLGESTGMCNRGRWIQAGGYGGLAWFGLFLARTAISGAA